ncbi:hypothetical protein B5S32_g3205 [[Candida] boidinii]|nr:hypothetical protein B5S32_g3205 [[Candida] boidinii]
MSGIVKKAFERYKRTKELQSTSDESTEQSQTTTSTSPVEASASTSNDKDTVINKESTIPNDINGTTSESKETSDNSNELKTESTKPLPAASESEPETKESVNNSNNKEVKGEDNVEEEEDGNEEDEEEDDDDDEDDNDNEDEDEDDDDDDEDDDDEDEDEKSTKTKNALVKEEDTEMELPIDLNLTEDIEIENLAIPDHIRDLHKSLNRKRHLEEIESTGGDKSNTSLNLNEKPNGNEKQRKKPKKYQIQKWTREEDQLIIYYKEEMKLSWKSIAQLIGKRHSWQAIQMRYLRSHKSRNDSWTRHDEIRLINAIRRDWENRWRRISADLGPSFNSPRCISKATELCRHIDDERISKIFEIKEVNNYARSNNTEDFIKACDIKDTETHKKLMLVYMGLDAISYESDEEGEE